MLNDKENLHPNLAHLFVPNSKRQDWLQPSPKISSFIEEKDWRRKLMQPSDQELQIESRLSRMLDHQQAGKQSLKTTLSEVKLPSYASSANHTLQKYFGQNHCSPKCKTDAVRSDILQIAQMVLGLLRGRSDMLNSMDETQLLSLIKSNLGVFVHEVKEESPLSA